MKFTKMQGLGNDYVYVDCFREQVADPSALAVRVSDRHFGIGSDGLILICPSDAADVRMDMYNADGSRGAMCGNGIRCVAKYAYEHALARGTEMTVETLSGIKRITVFPENGIVQKARVDMGRPILEPEKIPVLIQPEHRYGDSGAVISQMLDVNGTYYSVTCVSMGNPHCVVPVEDPDHLKISRIGTLFEHHEVFPDRVNTEFIRVLDRSHVQMRVWERGSGETLACGTGACAVAVACVLNDWTGPQVTVSLRGGDLEIFWDQEADTVFMTGPAVTVFEGEI